MALSTTVHDLRTLIRSSHPLVVIETVEEDRVLALLQSVAAQERMPLFEWSITRGLTRADEGPTLSKLTATPLAVLQHLHSLTVEAVFWLKDLAPHLEDPAVCRQLREAAAVCSRSRATCVLSGQPIALPVDLENLAVRLDLKLPDQDELRFMLRGLLQSQEPRASDQPHLTTLVQSMLRSLNETKKASIPLPKERHVRRWLSLAMVTTTMLAACTTPAPRSDTQPIKPLGASNRVEAPLPGPTPPFQHTMPEEPQEPPTNGGILIRSAIVQSASQLVGARTIQSHGRSVAYDCAGVTRAIFLEHGIDLYSNIPIDPKANGVRLIYTHVSRHGILHQGPVAAPGDLVFFDNTWDVNGDGQPNDPLTHIGVVEEVEPDGTVIFISRVAPAIARYRMNLDQPHVHKTDDGRVLNDYLRRKRPTDPEAIGRLTGELFAFFGNRLSP